MENRMTIEQVLEATRNLLGAINVPAALIEQVGIPIKNAIGNLNLCIGAIRENTGEKEEAENGTEADPE